MKYPISLRVARSRLSASRAGLPAVLVAVAVFLVTLALTGAAVLSANRALQAESGARFNALADRLQSELEQRLAAAEYALKGARAGYVAAGGITATGFHHYVASRELARYFPGVKGFALAYPGPGQGLITTHVEPAGPNADERGRVLAEDAIRQETAARAVATGEAALSAPLLLTQGGAKRTGWVLMVPIFRDANGEVSVARREGSAVEALLYAILWPSEMFAGVHDRMERIEFMLTDGNGPPLFDSRSLDARVQTNFDTAHFRTSRDIRWHGRVLNLRVAGTPALTVSAARALPWIIGLGGAVLSLLLGQAAWMLLVSRNRAHQLAMGMTSDLERMARVVERTSSAVFGLDMQGRITWANEGFGRLTGLAPHACIGLRASDLPQVVGTQLHARAAFQDAIDRRQARRMELANERADGSHFWTDAELQPTRGGEGEVTGFICIASDISLRKMAELRMQENEHLMRVITDNLPARVSYWDANRRCRFVNRRFREVFGRDAHELIGAQMAPQIFGDELLGVMEPYVQRVLTGVPQHFEHETRDRSGRTCSWQVHYIPDVDGEQVRGFFVLGLDVTELRRARDTALHASQAKSRFLSSMSHEIRTPMNAVLGMLALLRATHLNDRQQDYAQKAERAAQSLLALLNDILDLSKIEAGKMTLDPRPFALDDVLRDLSVILAGNVGQKDIEVLFDIDGDLPPRVVGDDMRLRQVLINLGGNAIKFTEQGVVSLRLRQLAREGDSVRLEVEVRDTGIGIAPTEQQRIFSDFAQASDATTRQFGGTGLGLSICKKLLEMMGSELRLESVPGRGSRFWFELVLPLTPTEAAASSGPVVPAVQRVLIVDDSPPTCEALAAMARALGWTADVAGGGHEALALIADAPRGAYDAVFLDWRMPDMDGWEVSQRIRSLPATASAPLVVMVTAHAREMFDERGPEEAELLDGFLVKPVTMTMLADALAQARGRDEARAHPAGAPPAPVSPRPLRGVRLLLVEDNLINQQVAVELLAQQGAQVEVANDGREGLERVRESPDLFDAVLMDVLMPEMDGHAAARAIREDGNWRLPIIAMTANAMESDRLESLAAGMNDHVGKPFDIQQLVETVLRHVRRDAPPLTTAETAVGGTAAPEPPAPSDAAGSVMDVDATAPAILDRHRAIERLGGDGRLYAHLLPSFSENLRGTRERLPTLLHSVSHEEAARLMHTLKGTASTLGADRLAQAAGWAESALGVNDENGRTSSLYAVATAIGQTLDALEGTMHGASPPAADAEHLG